METQQPIRLRSHHIISMNALSYLTLLASRSEPKRQELEEAKQENRRIYNAGLVARMDEILATFIRNPQTKIILVEGQDYICEACPHRENCARGDYSELIMRIKLERLSFRLNYKNPPEDGDKGSLQELNRKYGDTVSANSIIENLDELRGEA